MSRHESPAFCLMESTFAKCPKWLASRILDAGGCISFHEYMNLVLNDPKHGFYATGRLQIGPKGDFATSPSLGTDFAELLALQIIDWFKQLKKINSYNYPLSLVELGPGEGTLTRDLLIAIERLSPELLEKLQIILIEPNKGLFDRQHKLLRTQQQISISWKSLDELSNKPVFGIILAHELLDAFPVERIVARENDLYRQCIKIELHKSDYLLSYIDKEITKSLKNYLVELESNLYIKIPPVNICNGWNTEIHVELENWFNKVSRSLIGGNILIIDYILEARRYYSSHRNMGTIKAYRKQMTSNNLLNEAGLWDITSHQCLETVIYHGKKNGLLFNGEVRQGQALLSLGLAQRLHSLSNLPADKIDIALEKREALLRLVDPQCLGEFRWLAFSKYNNNETKDFSISTRFLEEPVN